MARAMLHEIAAVSILTFVTTDDGIADVMIESAVDPSAERDLVTLAMEALRSLGPKGVVVTHNGTAHDLPLLLRRSFASWMFDVQPLLDLLGDDHDRHFDTMLRFGGRGIGRPGGSLVDLCAGLGIPAVLPPPSPRRVIDPRVRKGQLDVAATAAAFLHWAAAERGSARWLANAWHGLAEHIVGRGPELLHLSAFARRGMELGAALCGAPR